MPLILRAAKDEALRHRLAATIPPSRRLIRFELRGELTARTLGSLARRLRLAPDAPVHLHIVSTGGLAREALDVAEMLAARTALVHGHAEGVCASAATLILAGCKRRTAEPGTTFMLHCSGGAPDLGPKLQRLTRHHLVELANHVDRLDSDMARFYARRLAALPETIQRWMDGADHEMSASTARFYGLLTELPVSARRSSAKASRQPARAGMAALLARGDALVKAGEAMKATQQGRIAQIAERGMPIAAMPWMRNAPPAALSAWRRAMQGGR